MIESKEYGIAIPVGDFLKDEIIARGEYLANIAVEIWNINN